MERSLSTTKRGRPWWMTPFAREPMGDIWSDRIWLEWPRMMGEEYSPIMDFYEKEGKYHIRADLPGVSKKDISINIDNDLVTIRGKRESTKEESDASYYIKESSYGSFSRSFKLPGAVDENKVEANFKDGVLNLVMPSKESTKTLKIRIKEG
ncbi:MAG: Hsp20/alpha crystallin family protein [Deltaproteobacteria bacterium]|nr:Hsp20/alpha crystallin family protein [Deltaproteobacteria bacterium]